MTPEIMNARITGTSLGAESHGIFSAFVHLEGDGVGISFGGYALDTWNEAERRRVGTAFWMDFLTGVMEAVGVETWEALKGQHVRVELEGLGGRALRLGHIIKDQWFDPKALADVHRAGKSR